MSNAYKRASLILQKAKGPKWKRELVSDHKFDFMDVDSFRKRTFLLTIRYMILICSVFISTLVYGADLWSAGILLIYDHWSLSTQPKIPFEISKWIYVGCIAISFMLLAWEVRKTRSVMATRDISLAVTNPLAYKTYSIKSYTYFCVLQKIKNSTRWGDVVIFYVFYTLKGWKKVIIAQGPRQIIAGFTVYALLNSALMVNGKFHFSTDWDTYGKDWPQRLALLLMSFTCILWIISAIQIFLAVLLYFPILCHIQGNLKEYCCHKIDKRIDELLEKQRKKRIREREKYTNSISSKKSRKSTKKETAPALPPFPVFNNNNNNVSPYAEKTDAQWLYQQPQQQNSFNNYYDSQPMTPLESSYSLQRNPTKYSPYNETYSQGTPSYAYAQPAAINDYYHTQQQYSNDITSPPLISNKDYYAGNNPAPTNVVSKPNTYDDVTERTSAGTLKSSHSYSQNNLKSVLRNQSTATHQEAKNKIHHDSVVAYYVNTSTNNASLQDQQYVDNTNNTKKKDPVYTNYI